MSDVYVTAAGKSQVVETREFQMISPPFVRGNGLIFGV